MRILLVVLGMCLMGCSMLKQTSKTEEVEHAEFENVVDSRSLVLKSAVREINTLTYNPDGSILQFQQIQEEIAQSNATEVSGIEKSSVKHEIFNKDSVPWKGWIWVAGIGITLVAIVVYLKVLK